MLASDFALLSSSVSLSLPSHPKKVSVRIILKGRPGKEGVGQQKCAGI